METAADGWKALGKLADFSPHVLLTDLKMPGMGTGSNFCKRRAVRTKHWLSSS